MWRLKKVKLHREIYVAYVLREITSSPEASSTKYASDFCDG